MTSGGWIDLPVLDGFYVYALYGAENPDVPLYVGQSMNALVRLGNHLGEGRKREQVVRIAVRQCASQADMDETEARLIVAYCPPWNTACIPYRVRRKRTPPRGATTAAVAALNEKVRQEFIASSLLTPRQVADRLHCSMRAVNDYVTSGSLRATPAQLWTDRRFRPEWVADLLELHPDLLAAAVGAYYPTRPARAAS